MPRTYEPIASTTLGSAAASHTFSSVPGTFTDLVVIVVGAGSTSSDVYLRFNGDTASNYSNTYLGNIGNSPASGRDPIPALGLISTGITVNHFTVMSYANTNVFKTSLGTAADPQDSRMFKRVTLWRSTAAITSVEVSKPSGNFNTGTTFSLYGIKAA
jgi:hypothetical protein